jgi:hypothetical protein
MGRRFKLGRSASSSRVLSLVAILLLKGAKPAAASSRLAALPGGPETFWLDVTNVSLGLFTLAACLWVAWGIVQEAVLRRRLRRLEVTAGGR